VARFSGTVKIRIVAIAFVGGIGAASCGHAQKASPPPAPASAAAPAPREPEFWNPDAAPSALVAQPTPPPPERPMPITSDGRAFSVRGVDASDVLFVRSAPGPRNSVVGQLSPDASGIVLTGPRRKVGGGEWVEITHGQTHGWVNARFLIEDLR